MQLRALVRSRLEHLAPGTLSEQPCGQSGHRHGVRRRCRHRYLRLTLPLAARRIEGAPSRRARRAAAKPQRLVTLKRRPRDAARRAPPPQPNLHTTSAATAGTSSDEPTTAFRRRTRMHETIRHPLAPRQTSEGNALRLWLRFRHGTDRDRIWIELEALIPMRLELNRYNTQSFGVARSRNGARVHRNGAPTRDASRGSQPARVYAVAHGR